LVSYTGAKVQASGLGVAFFYSQQKNYKKIKVDFSDSRFRLLNFDSKDYFASVKWKLNSSDTI
jgi:hypothetical protein